MLALTCRPAAAEAKLSFSGLSDMLAEIDHEALAALRICSATRWRWRCCAPPRNARRWILAW